MITEVTRILILTTISFIIAFILTFPISRILYKYKLGKPIRSEGTPIFTELHKKKEGTPTMGGIIIWSAVVIVILIFWLIGSLGTGTVLEKFNFLNRKQTFLPLGILIFSAIVGFADDLMDIFRMGRKKRGLTILQRLLIYAAVGGVGAWWFYFKLDWDLLHIPFIGDFNIGWWYIPLFMFIIIATAFSANETDGLDGLAGGVLLIAFGAFGILSYAQGRYDLAAFTGVIMGALVAFLWFNIYPARFFMGDTGSMSLGVTLGVIAMLTNSALLLPLIGFVMVMESGSVIIQIISKKFNGKKIFLSTPVHHHFEAKNWPETKVTMRFWIIAAIGAAIGVIIGLVG